MNNLSALKLVLSSLTSEPVEDMGRLKSNVQVLSEIISHFSGQEESFTFNPLAISRLAQLLPGALSGGGNATVPNDAPIRPPQAFVDAMIALDYGQLANGIVNLYDAGIESLSAAFILKIHQFVASSFGTALTAEAPAIELGENALNVATVNAILASMASVSGDRPNGQLTLDGGTNTEPTGGADNADIATLVSNGWNVSVNIGGVPMTFAP